MAIEIHVKEYVFLISGMFLFERLKSVIKIYKPFVEW